MNHTRKITLSATLILFLCFFLPWVQVSCGGATDSLSGVDLARDSHHELWLIPVLLAAVIFFNLVRSWRDIRGLSNLVELAGGLVTAYLMNRERLRAHDSSTLVPVNLTGWFWLGFFAAIAIVVTGIAILLRRPRAPGNLIP